MFRKHLQYIKVYIGTVVKKPAIKFREFQNITFESVFIEDDGEGGGHGIKGGVERDKVPVEDGLSRTIEDDGEARLDDGVHASSVNDILGEITRSEIGVSSVPSDQTLAVTELGDGVVGAILGA